MLTPQQQTFLELLKKELNEASYDTNNVYPGPGYIKTTQAIVVATKLLEEQNNPNTKL